MQFIYISVLCCYTWHNLYSISTTPFNSWLSTFSMYIWSSLISTPVWYSAVSYLSEYVIPIDKVWYASKSSSRRRFTHCVKPDNVYLSIQCHYDDTYTLVPVLHMYLLLRDNGPLPRRRGLTSFMIYVYSRPYQQAIVYIWLKDNCPPSTTTIYIVYYYIHPILHTVVVWLRHDFSHKCICFGCAIVYMLL